jgi:hypothetical protein
MVIQYRTIYHGRESYEAMLALVFLNVYKYSKRTPSANECSDLANSSCETIVLASDSSGTRFTGKKA